MPGSPEICVKPTRLTLNTRQFKKGTPKENCRLWYGIYRYIVQTCVQNPVKHLRRIFFGKIANDYKLFSDYTCEKTPSWMFDRVLNTYMKFMWYYIFYVMVISKQLHKSNDKYCLCNVAWSGDINHKPSILWELIFRRDLKQKLAPQRQ